MIHVKYFLLFVVRVIWNLFRSPYLSIVSAWRYAKSHKQKAYANRTKQSNRSNKGIRFIDGYSNRQFTSEFRPASKPQDQKKRRRRGHRGGKKHRKHSSGGDQQ